MFKTDITVVGFRADFLRGGESVRSRAGRLRTYPSRADDQASPSNGGLSLDGDVPKVGDLDPEYSGRPDVGTSTTREGRLKKQRPPPTHLTVYSYVCPEFALL